jgi:hypothetical protein
VVSFAGGDRLNTPFGYMLAPNITPDPDKGIGRWSADEFYRALHDGVNKRGQDMQRGMLPNGVELLLWRNRPCHAIARQGGALRHLFHQIGASLA